MCIEEIVLRLVNALKDANASIDYLNCHEAHAQKRDRDTFSYRSVALAARLQPVFLKELHPFISVDEAAYDAVPSIQGDVFHCLSTMREGLSGWLAEAVRKVVLVVFRVVISLNQWIQTPVLKIV